MPAKKTNQVEQKDAEISGSKDMLSKEAASGIAKKKRNRPDLANFGAENAEPGDNSRYLRHALSVFNLPPIDISDDKQVADRLDWYFNHCMEDDMKPTVTGMCGALGITKDTLWRWHRGLSRESTHSDLIKKAYAMLEALWEDYMISGKVNPASGIFLGRNHWGYQDQVEVVVQPKMPLGEEPDQKALEAKIADVVIDTEGTESP